MIARFSYGDLIEQMLFLGLLGCAKGLRFLRLFVRELLALNARRAHRKNLVFDVLGKARVRVFIEPNRQHGVHEFFARAIHIDP